jgi:hypothetical protein
MADTPQPQSADQPIQSQSELIAQLQNIARQLSGGVQSIVNATPAATTTTSPQFTAVTLSTTTAVIIGASTSRHGILFHNPATTNALIYQTNMTPAPTSTNFAGAIVILPQATLVFPSSHFPNVNAGFSGYSQTGTSQPFTIVEFH